MRYSKKFICLANSKKFSGRCVAGLEIIDGKIADWVRPISSGASEELSIDDRRYQDGQDVKLLDIVEVQLTEHRPHACQTENHVIDDKCYWARIGTASAHELIQHAVRSGPLWKDGESSYSGENDRITEQVADLLSSSLKLVFTEHARFIVGQGFKKRQVRVAFHLGQVRYNLTVTDPKLEVDYLGRKDGAYDTESSAIICISLSEPFGGYRYKLAASVIPI